MKSVIVLFIVALALTGLIYTPNLIYALDTSPVITSTVDAPIDPLPPLPDEPVPLPPTLLELIVKLFTEAAGWLTGVVLLGLGIGQKWLVTLVIKFFDEKTAKKIEGGIAELTAGATAIAVALIAGGLAYATDFVSSADLLSLAELAGLTFVSGWSVHKVSKKSSG